MNQTKRSTLSYALLLLLALFPLQGFAQEALPPAENVRVENGAIVWDAPTGIESIIGNARLKYNVYRASSTFSIFVATVVDSTEFRPTLDDRYIVVPVTFNRFGRNDEAAVVDFDINVGLAPALTTLSNYEIRTNRCTNVALGESCAVSCGGNLRKPTGGACRADGAVVVHSEARHDGYACLTTADTAYVEVDVFCHR